MVILGIDLGKARTGVAVSTKARCMASPLCVIKEHNRERLLRKSTGFPKSIRRLKSPWDCRETWMAPKGRAPKTPGSLASSCGKNRLPVALIDERGTTVTAHGYLNPTDVRGKKRKARLTASPR